MTLMRGQTNGHAVARREVSAEDWRKLKMDILIRLLMVETTEKQMDLFWYKYQI